MNTTKPKLLLLSVGIILSCNAVAAPKPNLNKPATVKQLKKEIAERLKSDQALLAAIKGLGAGIPGTPGVPGAPGAPGAQGSTAITSTSSFAGPMETIPANEAEFSYHSPTATVTTITADQTITATVTAVLATKFGKIADFQYNLCYQDVTTTPGGPITEFTPEEYFSVTATPKSTPFNASQSKVFRDPGVYNIGMCIRNASDIDIEENGWMEGWVLVSD